ncbi:unnamed protein product [Rhizophagus irregularis]|nr:unnamed protein product [Rhizophagus irregularis]
MRQEIDTMKEQIRKMKRTLASDVENRDEIIICKDKFRRAFDKVIRVFIKIRRGLSLVKIRRAFDDFLFLLSLFILPSIVFHENNEIPPWISIFSWVTAGVVFITIIINYIFWHINFEIMLEPIYFLFFLAIIDLCNLFRHLFPVLYSKYSQG